MMLVWFKSSKKSRVESDDDEDEGNGSNPI